jgi:hypothetical protein
MTVPRRTVGAHPIDNIRHAALAAPQRGGTMRQTAGGVSCSCRGRRHGDVCSSNLCQVANKLFKAFYPAMKVGQVISQALLINTRPFGPRKATMLLMQDSSCPDVPHLFVISC